MNTDALKNLGPETIDLAKKTLPGATKIVKDYLETGVWPEEPKDSHDNSLEAILARAEKLDATLKQKLRTKDDAKLLLKTLASKAIDIALHAAMAGL